MLKKSLILLILTICILSFNSICFAEENMANDVKNAVNGATNTVVDGASNLTKDVRDGISNAENTVENAAGNVGNAISDGANSIENIGNDAYTATRTSAQDITNQNGINGVTLTWIVLAIAAVVIVTLVWYYGSQNVERH